jgi:hypothetical protein
MPEMVPAVRGVLMRNDVWPTRLALPALTVVLGLSSARPVGAQASPKCTVLCAPAISLMPAVLRSHLFGGPRVEKLATGEVTRLPSLWNFELIVAGAAKTAIPRLSLFGSVQWLPNATEQRNPFTLYTAGELGGAVHANAPTVTVGASGSVLSAAETDGMADVDVNVGDLFSQAARPDDRSAYTHKLDLDLVTHWHVFRWTAPESYAHRVTLFAILDYVATGLPRAGDEVPQGRRFVDDARPTSFIGGLSLPITPEVK